MAENSDIEWCDSTWNPVVGCSVTSPGCTNCYAMKLAGRLAAMGSPIYAGHTIKTKAGYVWNGKVSASNHGQMIKPLSWKKPRRIFVNSMSDLFHDDTPEDLILDVFTIMAIAEQHTFQVLTKRSERMRDFMERPDFLEDIYANWSTFSGGPREVYSWPLHNVHLGVSVEDVARKYRINDLRETPAAKRFISFEPLLECVGDVDLTGIHQCITGGESGPGKRPHDPDWQRNIFLQCREQGVAFFGKQWDKVRPLPDDLMVREFPT
jgi:protein gp37